MTFPTIPTTGNSRIATVYQNNTTATRTFPDLSTITHNAGDLLIAIVAVDKTTGAPQFTWGNGGFTQMGLSGGTSQPSISAGYKWSDGTETGTFTVTQNGTISGHAAMVVMSIPGAHQTTPPEIVTTVGGTTTIATPSSLTPSWGSDDTLWLAVGAVTETATAGSYTGLGTTPPTNYTNQLNQAGGVTADIVGAVDLAVAFRQLTAASEDPGNFANDTSNAAWSATTIAVRPAPPVTTISASDGAAITITASAAINGSATVSILGDQGDANSITAGTTMDVSNASLNPIPAGTLLVLSIVSDNPASLTAPNISFTNNITGGTWTQLASPQSSGVTTTAGSGIYAWTYYVYTTSSIAGTTRFVTINWDVSVGAKAAMALGYVGTAGAPYGVNTGTSATGAVSISTSASVVTGDVAIGLAFSEDPSAAITLGGTINGSAVNNSTSTTPNDANVSINTSSKVATSTGTLSFSKTAGNSNDGIAVVGAFAAAPGMVVTQESVAITIAESSSVVATSAVSGSESEALTIAETSSVANTLSTSESEAVTIAESRALNSSSTSTESEAVTITETSGISSPTATSESEAVTITDSSVVVNVITSSDSAQIHVDESAIIPTPGIGDFALISSATAKASGTTLTFTNTSGVTIPAGSLIIVGVVSDNPASVTAPTFSTTNNNTGGTWNFLATTIGSGVTTTAGSGIWTYSFYLYSTVDVPNGTVISTITWSASVVGRAGVMSAYTGVTGAPYGGGTAVSTAGTPTKTTTSITNGDLVVGIGYGESASITGDTDTLNGSWDAIDFAGTTGSTDATNVSVCIQDKVVTSAGTQTYNPTTSADSAVHVGAFAAAPLVIVSSSDSAYLTIIESPGSISQGGGTTPTGTESPQLTITESSSVDVLGTFKTALASRATARVNIGMLGASIVEGYPAAFNLSIEQKLAAKIRAAYGVTSAGMGYVGIPSTPVQGIATSPVAWSAGTYNEVWGWGERHGVWYTTPAQNATISFTMSSAGTSVNIGILLGTTGSATGGRYRVNGGSWTTFNTLNAGGTIRGEVNVSGPFAAGSVIDVGFNAGTGNVVITGFEHYNNDESSGIQVHNYGHSGYTIAKWQAQTGGTPQWIDEIVAEMPDLLILQDFGGNDGNSAGTSPLSAATFKTNFGTFIDSLRTSGFTKPIMIVADYDTSAGITFVDPWQSYVTAMRDLAHDKGCAFLDLTLTMPATPNAIYDADNVHGNANGAAYDIIADRILAAATEASYDWCAITIAETSSVSGTASTSESEALTITESSSVAVTQTTTDTAAVTITDSSSPLIIVSTSESEAVTIADVSTSSSTLSTSESEAITISDVSSVSIVNAVSTTDTAAVTITDVSASVITMTRTESEALTFTETSAVSGTVSASESEAVTISEVSNAGANLPGAETEALSIAETSLVALTPTTSESEAVTITDVSSVLVSVSTTDTAAVTITDASTPLVLLNRPESEALTIADVSSVTIVTFVVASESEALTFTETSSVSGTMSSSESEAITISESASAGQNNNISRPESEALTITETSSVFATVVASESEAMTITEATDSFRTVPVSESEAITISDVANVNITAGLPGTESIAVTITESRVLDGSSTSTESEALTITDASASQIQENRPESEAVTITESRTLAGSSTSTESEAVTITESRSLAITTFVSTSDTGAITITDTTAALVVAQPATESEALTISEATDTVVGLTKTATDGAAITISSIYSQSVIGHNESYVRYQGAWVHGTLKLFHNGAWVHIVPKVYRSGIWT